MDDIAMQDAGPDLIRAWVDRAARLYPNKPYIVSAEDGRAITFGEFSGLVRRIGSFLNCAKIVADDRVALFAANSIEHVACYVGVMAYGATICTVNVEMNRSQLDRIMAQLRPRLAIYDDDLIQEADLGVDRIPSKTQWLGGAGLRCCGAADSSPSPCGEETSVAQPPVNPASLISCFRLGRWD